jgi:hypothetical protein
MRRLALVCLILALGAADADQVQVQRMPEPPPDSIGLRGEIRYSLARGNLNAILSYVSTSRTLILHFDGQPAPTNLVDQAALLQPLLARFLTDQAMPPRLTLLIPEHAQIVSRLAAVLAACSNWNGNTGLPARGALGQFLVDTLNRHNLAGEVAAVFTDHGYRFAASSASLIGEGHVAEFTDRLLPTSVGYLSFTAEQPDETQRSAPWPTQSQRSTC